jgi:hypothetical protein
MSFESIPELTSEQFKTRFPEFIRKMSLKPRSLERL